MGLLSNRIEREELKPGDHVYSWRTAYTYAHHGIYTGDGMIIHFTRGGQEIGTGTFLDWFLVSSSPSRSGIPCEKCGDQSMLHGVLKSCLDCFLSGGELHIFLYSASPALFLAQARGGTCTLAASDPQLDVLCRANYLLQKGFGTYNIFKNNCEDFAIYCKTGLLVNDDFSLGRSGQLGSFVAAGGALTASPLLFLSLYCFKRYVSDIGIRRNVVKIPVEVLVAEQNANESEGAKEATERG